MPETSPGPLDLSQFDTAPLVGGGALAVSGALAPVPAPARLVDVGNLPASELAEAEAAARQIDFASSASLLAHGEGALAGIAAASRELLTGVRLGEAGEAGRIAASVLDGIRILRVSDLQGEAQRGGARRPGLVGRVLGGIAQARSAFAGFAENRKRFLQLMDAEQAKARRIQADLGVSIRLLDEQDGAIRRTLHGLKIAIAAGQIALDRAEVELEEKRLAAIATGDPSDAAHVGARRASIANFRGKVGDLREALVGSALLIPIIAQNRAAAETRMMKISNGMLVVIPRLMAVASQAVVQNEIHGAAEAAARLDEANRQVTLLAAKGAHTAATEAARANAGDPRNLEALAAVADETIRTMHEVIDIERETAALDLEREGKLVAIRDRLVVGMQGVNARTLER